MMRAHPDHGDVADALQTVLTRLMTARMRLYHERSLFANPTATAVLGDVTECTDLIDAVLKVLRGRQDLADKGIELPATKFLIPTPTKTAPVHKRRPPKKDVIPYPKNRKSRKRRQRPPVDTTVSLGEVVDGGVDDFHE